MAVGKGIGAWLSNIEVIMFYQQKTTYTELDDDENSRLEELHEHKLNLTHQL